MISFWPLFFLSWRYPGCGSSGFACRFFSAKVLIKIAQKCLGSISMPGCKQTGILLSQCACSDVKNQPWIRSFQNIFPFFPLIKMDWVGHFGKLERTLWDLGIVSPRNWKWDLMQIVALKVFVQPYKIGVWFTTGKVFHCLEIGLSFARENYIAHFLPKFIVSTSLFILITFVNLLIVLSVNSSMLALDEKKTGVGIADFCLIYLQKASGFQNSLLRRSFHSVTSLFSVL